MAPVTTPAGHDLDDKAKPGYAGYSSFVLSLYDFWVHGINNRFFWKCPTRILIQLYRSHVTGNHLEIGPGTGYLLDKSGLPGSNPRLVLCDMNVQCLHRAGHRLRRYHPILEQRNVLRPLDGLGDRFQSVGLNYVLHCLPGDLEAKRTVFAHIAACLEPGGVLFGSTLLGSGVPLGAAARMQMRWLNRKGYLSNLSDSLPQLEAGLGAAFAEHRIEVHGCAAVFVARTHK